VKFRVPPEEVRRRRREGKTAQGRNGKGTGHRGRHREEEGVEREHDIWKLKVPARTRPTYRWRSVACRRGGENAKSVSGMEHGGNFKEKKTNQVSACQKKRAEVEKSAGQTTNCTVHLTRESLGKKWNKTGISTSQGGRLLLA